MTGPGGDGRGDAGFVSAWTVVDRGRVLGAWSASSWTAGGRSASAARRSGRRPPRHEPGVQEIDERAAVEGVLELDEGAADGRAPQATSRTGGSTARVSVDGLDVTVSVAGETEMTILARRLGALHRDGHGAGSPGRRTDMSPRHAAHRELPARGRSVRRRRRPRRARRPGRAGRGGSRRAGHVRVVADHGRPDRRPDPRPPVDDGHRRGPHRPADRAAVGRLGAVRHQRRGRGRRAARATGPAGTSGRPDRSGDPCRGPPATWSARS